MNTHITGVPKEESVKGVDSKEIIFFLKENFPNHRYPGIISSKNPKQDQPQDYSKAHN